MTTINKEFAAAIVKMQGLLQGAKKDSKNPFHNSNYADLSACWDAALPALQASGLAFLQFPVTNGQGFGLASLLVHGESGETLGEVCNFTVKDPSNPQQVGSAMTYMRRYQLCAALGICPEDDDGNGASVVQKSTPKVKPGYADINSAQVAFDQCVSIDAKKEVYALLKSSTGLDEAAKAQTLKTFADSIKAAKDGAK